jgi:histidine triad (HIT) family protein
MSNKDCVFCKIIAKEIPANIVYEDKNIIVIKDINPQARVHLLMIPKSHFAGLDTMGMFEGIALGKGLKEIPKLAKKLGFEDGYRLVVNRGEAAGQTVFHFHVHILAGENLREGLVP